MSSEGSKPSAPYVSPHDFFLKELDKNKKKRKSPTQETNEDKHKDKKPVSEFVGKSSEFKRELAERGATVTHQNSEPKAVAQLKTPGKKDAVRPRAEMATSGRTLFDDDDKKPPAPVEETKPPAPRPKTPPVPSGKEVYNAFYEGSPKRTIPEGAQSVAPLEPPKISRKISYKLNEEDGTVSVVIDGYTIGDEQAFESDAEDIFAFLDSIVAGEEELRRVNRRRAENFDDFIKQQQDKIDEAALEEAIKEFGIDPKEPLPPNKQELKTPVTLRF